MTPGPMCWVERARAGLNRSRRTFDELLKPLIAEAHERVAPRQRRRTQALRTATVSQQVRSLPQVERVLDLDTVVYRAVRHVLRKDARATRDVGRGDDQRVPVGQLPYGRCARSPARRAGSRWGRREDASFGRRGRAPRDARRGGSTSRSRSRRTHPGTCAETTRSLSRERCRRSRAIFCLAPSRRSTVYTQTFVSTKTRLITASGAPGGRRCPRASRNGRRPRSRRSRDRRSRETR